MNPYLVWKNPPRANRRQQHGPAYGQGGEDASQEPGSRQADAGRVRQHHPYHVLQQEGVSHRHHNPGGGNQQLVRQGGAHADARSSIDIIKEGSVQRSGHQGGGIIFQGGIHHLPVIHVFQVMAAKRPNSAHRQEPGTERPGRTQQTPETSIPGGKKRVPWLNQRTNGSAAWTRRRARAHSSTS